MAKKNGGPAFPDALWHSGMTLRDYYAGQALPVVLDRLSDPSELRQVPRGHVDDVARAAYAIADAMLRERGK